MPDLISESSDSLFLQILSLVFFGVVNLEFIIEEVVDVSVDEWLWIKLVSDLHLKNSFKMELVFDGPYLNDVVVEKVVLEEPREGLSGNEDFPRWVCEGNDVFFDVVEEVSVFDGHIIIHSFKVINLFSQIAFEHSQMIWIDERNLPHFWMNGFLFSSLL